MLVTVYTTYKIDNTFRNVEIYDIVASAAEETIAISPESSNTDSESLSLIVVPIKTFNLIWLQALPLPQQFPQQSRLLIRYYPQFCRHSATTFALFASAI